MYSSSSFEFFYIIKVARKTTAEDNLCDHYGHNIQKGSQYVKGYNSEKVSEKKWKIMYKQLKQEVFIHPFEIFCPAVPIADDLSLSLQ